MANKAVPGARGLQRTHGSSRSRGYLIWARMKANCTNPKAAGWPFLGERGIGFDPAWATYEGFLADMGECPEGHTLKRRHHDDGYHKGNCEWLPLPTARKSRR